MGAELLAVQNVFTDRRAYVNASTYDIETTSSASSKQSKQQDLDEYKSRSSAVEMPDGKKRTFKNFDDLEETYTTPEDKPFHWLGRLRMTGGRTNVWGRVSLRFSDFDLKSADFDGYGENWPLSYKDIEPYYNLVEDYVGICGLAEGLEGLPDSKFQPPMPLTCQELLLRVAGEGNVPHGARAFRRRRDRALLHEFTTGPKDLNAIVRAVADIE